eukprot:4344315-Prorocentrum_lima.AAC.1
MASRQAGDFLESNQLDTPAQLMAAIKHTDENYRFSFQHTAVGWVLLRHHIDGAADVAASLRRAVP